MAIAFTISGSFGAVTKDIANDNIIGMLETVTKCLPKKGRKNDVPLASMIIGSYRKITKLMKGVCNYQGSIAILIIRSFATFTKRQEMKDADSNVLETVTKSFTRKAGCFGRIMDSFTSRLKIHCDD